MIDLIILGLLQAIFLPGTCFIIFSQNNTFIEKLNLSELFCFAVLISAFINYFLVIFLYSLQLYTQEVMLGIIFCEIIFIGLKIKWKLLKSNEMYLLTINKNYYIYRLIFLTFPIVYFWIFKSELLTVFSGWDAVVSWNRWAVELFNGNLQSTWGYPLGLPALISLVYKVANETNIQLFAKWICWIWPLVGAMLLLNCSYRYKPLKFEFIITPLIFLYLMDQVFFPGFIFSGYVDPIMSVYGAFSIYCYLFLYLNRTGQDVVFNWKNYLILGLLLSGGAFFKLTMFWLIGVFCILQLIYIPRSSRKAVLQYAFCTISIGLVSISWYFWVFIGANDFPVSANFSLMDDSILKRVVGYAGFLRFIFGWTLSTLFIFSLLVSRVARITFLTIIFPLFLFCAVVAGYDIRASYILYAPISLLISISVCYIIRVFCQLVPYIINRLRYLLG